MFDSAEDDKVMSKRPDVLLIIKNKNSY